MRAPPPQPTRPTMSADDFRSYKAEIKTTEPKRYQRHRRKKRIITVAESLRVPDLYGVETD